jgi:two-component system chemotaxis sensor kinase CheA
MIDLSLLQDFIPEAMEHLEEMESNLIRLESEPGNSNLLNNIFRSAHTIKGSSEYMGMKQIAGLAHKMESLLDVLRSSGISADRAVIDILMASRDRIVTIIGELEESSEEKSGISDLVERMEQVLAGENLDAPVVQSASDHAEIEPSVTGNNQFATGTTSVSRVCDKNVKKDISGLKSALFDATSKGITETRKQLILEYIARLSKVDAGDDAEVVARTFDAMKKDVKAMVYADDAGDVLASLHGLLVKIKCSTVLDEKTNNDESSDDSENDFLDDELDAEIAEATNSLFDDDLEDPIFDDNEEITADDLSETSDANEVYDEEYDEELFGIFMDHLKENFEKLDHQIALSIHSDDIGEIIEHCSEMVSGLQSSASYMDYKGLNDLYENLKKEIEQAAQSIGRGQTVSLEFIRSYMKQISGRFPKYKKSLLEIIESKAGTDRTATTTTPEVVEEKIIEHEEHATERVDKTAVDMPEEETQGLFDELDNVFDNNIEAVAEEVDEEAFDGDIEDMLSSIGPESTVSGRIDTKSDRDTDSGIVTQPEKPVESGKIIETEPVPPKMPVKTPVKKKEPDFTIEEEKIVMADESEWEKPVTEVADIDAINSEIASAAAESVSKKEESGSVHYDYTGEKIVKQSLRVDTRKIDALMNQVGELVVSRASYSQLSVEMRELEHMLRKLPGIDSKDFKRVRNLSFRIGEATVALGRVANDLQEGVMKVRMLPIAQLFNRYPRLIRDLVHDTDKQVHLEMKGEETELDKMVIEQIADPMIHIIRNAVDHGIETATERLAKGKPEEATLTLESYHESNHVVVEIIDDGRGIDPELIKREALQKKFTTVEEVERLNSRELISLIMRPGFSTSSEVTKTSGRGVGMDVVKKNIEKLNGTIDIDSVVGEGTRVRIKIPLTMAIIQALLVRVGKEVFTIPLSSVEETIRTHEDEISIIDGVEVIHLRNATLSLLRLTKIFGKQSTTQDMERPYVVVVNTGMKRVGLVVDALIGQEETVIKPLADYLQEKSGFSGATILGDGSISLILDVYELVNLTINKRTKVRDYTGNYMSSGTVDTSTDDQDASAVTIH